MAPLDWVLVVATGIGGVFGLFCLFDGARRIKLYGANAASSYLIGIGGAICLALAAYSYWQYSEQGGAQTHFVGFVMWLAWGAAALVFGALFAREPAPEQQPGPAEPITKIEPVLAPPVAARAPQPPAAPPKPVVGLSTTPLPKPKVGEDTVPLPKPAVGGDTVPLPKPGIPPNTVPLAKPSVGDDTIPLPKPAPGTFTPPKKE